MTYLKLLKVSVASLILAGPIAMTQTAMADFVINDDLIVDGSTCVGFDCVNGETFGSDTLRLKENNTRIAFTDTSTVSSFPTTDWTLIANSNVNGGGSYFAIQDDDAGRIPFLVTAGAPANSLMVASSGRIGIGTGSPVQDIHTVDGDTPTLRLEQNGSSGFAPQTWDIAGNETNFFIRDASNGSTLPFRIQPGADSNALFVDDTSNIGIGTASPLTQLHVQDSDDEVAIRIENTGAGIWNLLVSDDDGEFGIDDTDTDGTDFLFKTADDALNVPWEFVHRVDNGLGINIATSVGADFILSDAGDLTVRGTITSSGPTCAAGCDAVFDDDYALPTIEDHAELMFANRHLPTVGPTSRDIPINLTEHMGNVLNELEKAHIYIAQLNERNKVLEGQNMAFEARLQQLEKALD